MKPKPKFSRERAYFDVRRGKTVVVNLVDGDHETGKLLWVDRYTLCIALEASGDEKLIYKHAIKSLS